MRIRFNPASAAALLALAGVFFAPALPVRAADPAPTLVSVSPDEGSVAGDTIVTLTGTNFRANMSVLFGSLPGQQLTIINDTTLTVRTPAAPAGTVSVTVTHDDPPPTSATLPDAFTFVLEPCYAWVPRARGADTEGNAGGLDVTVVDMANGVVTGSVDLNAADQDLPSDTDWRPSQILFDAGATLAFVASAGTPGTLDSRKIWILSVARVLGKEEGNPVLSTIDTGGNPVQIALSVDRKRLYAADSGSWAGSATLLPNGKFRGWDVTDPAAPVALAGTPGDLGILPVLSYNSTSYQTWGPGSSFLGLVQSRSSRCVVVNSFSHSISLVDTGSLGVVGTFDVGVADGGLVQLTTAVPSPYDDDFVYLQTTDLTSGNTEYFIFRLSTQTVLRKGVVPTPMTFFQVLPVPDPSNRSAWPHPDGRSLVTIPATDASVASFNTATGSAAARTAIQGGGPPTALGFNDVTGLYYAREADGGWTVFDVEDTTTGGAAPAQVRTVDDTLGYSSFRVVMDGKRMAATGTSALALVDADTASPTVHTVVKTVPLPLDPRGGGLFPQPGPSGCGPARTFVTPKGDAVGPRIVLPLAASLFCSEDEPAQFEFENGGIADAFELELGSQPDFLTGPGNARTVEKVAGDTIRITPRSGRWRKVLHAAAGSVERPLYARINAVRGGRFRTYGEVVSFQICPPETCELLFPEDGELLGVDENPEFEFTAHGTRAWIEFAGAGGFESGRILRTRIRGDLPVDDDAVFMLPEGKWRKLVRKAQRIDDGAVVDVHWRIVCEDSLRRRTTSEEFRFSLSTAQ